MTMKCMSLGFALVAGLAAGAVLSNPGVAQEQKGNEKSRGIVLESKEIKRPLMAGVNFLTEYGLSFDSLSTIGARIDQSRKVSDPVGLAAAAGELAVAERISGKKAPITAAALMEEAVKLARLRDRSTELKAVGLMVHDEGLGKELAKLGAAAEKREEAAIRDFKSGEKSRGILGRLTVVNNTGYTMQITINGQDVFWVRPYRDFTWPTPIGHGPGMNTVITAYAQEDPTKTWAWPPVDDVRQNLTIRVP
jgi:hypothetical protein